MSCHTQDTKATGNGRPWETRKSRQRKTVMSGEVRGDAGKGVELGTMGGEMRRVEERREKEVERLIGG